MKFQFGSSPVFLSTALLLTGCVYGDNKENFETVQAVQADSTDTTTATTAAPTATPPAICNPFGTGTTSTQVQNGIKAQMWYYNAADVTAFPPNHVADMYAHGHLAPATFYFNNLDVPTQAFDRGFEMDDGSFLSKPDGTKLIEWFAFQFKASIKLPTGSAPETKQFALLADDGANFLVQDPITKAWTTNVSNDGQHSSTFQIGTAPVTVTSDTYLPVQIQYYQGPRVKIALMLLWRDIPANSSTMPTDPWEGKAGDTMFFNSSTVPSTPLASFNDMMTRWEVVPADVFYLDTGATVNPCN